MGIDLVKECCIGESHSNNTPQDTDTSSELSNSILIKATPLNSIDIDNQSTYQNQSQTQKLSRLPIQTKNVIRSISGNPYDIYEMIDIIGEGAIGKVKKVKHKLTGQIRAMKIISSNLIKKSYSKTQLENEIEILKAVSHPNIIKLYEVYQDDNFYYLISEYCSDGDLCSALISAKRIDESIVQKLMFQIFSSVSYLHSQRIIHGDLKLENVMIDRNTYEMKETQKSFLDSIQEDAIIYKNNQKYGFDNLRKFDLKLIDFGCSHFFTIKQRSCYIGEECGTLFYSSPELLNNCYNEKSDIWACGVIMYILLTGEIPFQGATESEIHDKILDGKYCFFTRLFKNISEKAKDLIRKCFIFNPNLRITAREALTHSFFRCSIPSIVNDSTSIEALSSLASASNKSKLFQTVITYLTHNYVSKDEITKCKKLFSAIDTDVDGQISKEELTQCFNQMGMDMSNENIDKIIKKVDFDNDGFISFPEFLQSTISLDTLLTDRNLKDAFKLFDKKNNNKVSVKEVKEVLGINNNTGAKIVSKFNQEINKSNEEEELTFEEFKEIIIKYR